MANVILQDAAVNNDTYTVSTPNTISSKLDAFEHVHVLGAGQSQAASDANHSPAETTIVIQNDLSAPWSTDKSYVNWLTAGFNRLVKQGRVAADSVLNIRFESSTTYNENKAPEGKRQLHANYKRAFHNQKPSGDETVGLFIYGAWEPDVAEKVDGQYTTTQDVCYQQGWDNYTQHRDAGVPVVTFCRGSHAVLEQEGVALGKGESVDTPNGDKIKSFATITRLDHVPASDAVCKDLPKEIVQQVSRIFRCNEQDIHDLEEQGKLRILYTSPEEGVGSAIIQMVDHDVQLFLGHPEAQIKDMLAEDVRDFVVRGGKSPDGKIDLELTRNIYPDDFDFAAFAEQVRTDNKWDEDVDRQKLASAVLAELVKQPFVQELEDKTDANIDLAASQVLRAFDHAANIKAANSSELELEETASVAVTLETSFDGTVPLAAFTHS